MTRTGAPQRGGWQATCLLALFATVGAAASAASAATLRDRSGDLATYNEVTGAAVASWRQHYLHPLRDADGMIVTEDGPVDHPHQRGLYWAWRRIIVDGVPIADSWTGRNFELVPDPARARRFVADSSRIDARVRWRVQIAGRPEDIVAEQLRIRVLRSRGNERRMHVRIRLTALREGIAIAGTNDEKGYGGPSLRLVDTPSLAFSSDGQRLEPAIGAVDSGATVRFQWPTGDSRAPRSVSIECRINGKPWRAWVLRSVPSMQNCAFPGRTPYPLPTDRALQIDVWVAIDS